MQSQSENKSRYPDPVKNKELSLLEVDNWIISEFITNNLVKVVGWHPFPLTELQLIVATVCYFKPKAIFEWGTHIGKSARIFYEIKSAFNLQTLIHSIDLPDDAEHVEHPGNTRGMMVQGLEDVVLHQGDGVTESIKIARSNKLSGKEILFFVDGDHSYESVKRELTEINAAFPDATILLHDTFFQDSKSGYNVGPHRAIEEFCNQHKSYISISMETGLPGMTLLYTT